MKILVAIPVYDGKLPVETARCLLNEKAVAHGFGDDIIVEFLPGCSHPAMGRNQLADAFLKSDCERIVFLDSDVSFAPGSILKIAHMPHDFVGGAYRFKLNDENYPVGWDDSKTDLHADKYGLLEVTSVPGGLMSLSRKVFESIREAHPERYFEHMGKKLFCYFMMPYKYGHLCGEDSHFCMEWRETGGKVYLDPELTLTHWDFSPKPYVGHIGNWLKNRPNEQVGEKCRQPAI